MFYIVSLRILSGFCRDRYQNPFKRIWNIQPQRGRIGVGTSTTKFQLFLTVKNRYVYTFYIQLQKFQSIALGFAFIHDEHKTNYVLVLFKPNVQKLGSGSF